MIHTVTTGITTDIGVTLLNSSDAPVIGVAVGDITVTYRKNGASSFTTKSVLAGEWNEVGDGLYRLTFTAGELNTSGSFRVMVKGAAFERYEADLIIADDFEDLATQIASLKADLALKANIRDTNILVSERELRLKEAELRIADLNNRLQIAESALSILRSQS
jgi:hypothetical protein